MVFEKVWMLWALLVPLGLFVWIILMKKERLTDIFDAEVLKRLLATDEGISSRLRNSMFLLAIVFLILALARPMMEKGDKIVEVEGLTLLVGLDISGSMRSTDMYPNRLSFAKQKMSMLFDAMPSDEIGISAFAYSSFVVAPFSSDKQTLKMILEGIDDSYINMGSTDFSALGRLASTLLEEKKPKVLVLFSDGGDEEAIAGFADILKEEAIDLYVVLVGTEEGSPVLDKEGKPLNQKDGTIAITQRNDALGLLAQKSGGAFVIADNGKQDIEELVSVIRSKYQNQEQGEVLIKEKIEYFYYPLGLGILLLLLAFSSLPKRKES
ncbi:BatB [hydrothermal vent metagenome]|uniref:BatB n=1 Tax=hydrothermal vent metagenome TaxID=652676 RepID=A0A1W1CZU0_9ZZZZ